MKREKFRISYNGKETFKAKWNSSIRETEAIIREIARAENTTYTLIGSESIKEGSNHVKGFREWYGENGLIVCFRIEKV